MTGATMFSGIRAPEVAMPWVDWKWAADIEKFPNLVGRRRFRDVPNLGNVTAADFVDRAKSYGPIDLLVAGWPCQDLSVAGKRMGLAGARSGLFFHLIGAIKSIKPRWVALENVPGLVSSHKGVDFNRVLDEIESAGYVIDVDILDAQFFGVAQRRRRVFIVCQAVDDLLQSRTISSSLTIMQLLLEVLQQALVVISAASRSEYISWDSGKKDRCADGLKRRIKLFSLLREDSLRMLLPNLGDYQARCLPTGRKSATECHGVEETENTSQTRVGPLLQCGAQREIWSEYSSIEGLLSKASGDISPGATSFTTSTSLNQITESTIYTCSQVALRIASLIAQSNSSCPVSWSAASSALTAIPDFINYASQASSNLFADVEWIQPWGDFIRDAESTTLALRDYRDRADPPAVFPVSEGIGGNFAKSGKERKDVTGSLAARTKGGGGLGTDFDLDGGLVAKCLNAKGGAGRIDGESETFITAPLTDASEDGTGRGTPLVTVGFQSKASASQTMNPSDISPPIDVGKSDGLAICFDTTQITSKTNRSNPQPGDPCHPLASGAHPPTLAFRASGQEGFTPSIISPPIASTDGGGAGVPTLAFNLRGREGGAMPEVSDVASLRAASGGSSRSYLAGYGVRRLTPIECARLQGFPDTFCHIYRRKKRKITPETAAYYKSHGLKCFLREGQWFTFIAADGPIYKAYGNSMAVPVVKWIGDRIRKVHEMVVTA